MKITKKGILLFLLLLGNISIYSMKYAVGKYTGTGSGTKAVGSFGFQPEVILVKPSNSGDAFVATSTMPSGNTKRLSASTLASNYVNSLDANGFTAGTSANASSVTYYYIAFDDDADIDVGTFTGSTSAQAVNVGYRPAMAWVLGTSGDWNDYGNVSQDGWDSYPDAFINGSILDASSASMSTYTSTGFNIPASGSSGVDNGSTYHYVTFKNSNVYTGTYTGTGNNGLTVNIGAAPAFVMVKNTSDQNNNMWFRTSAMSATESYKFTDVVSTIAITSFTSSGMTLGTQGEVNGTGQTLQYFALGAANAVLPVELTAFNGEKNGNYIDLTWQTASEVNSNYFMVERSSDGINFERIATVNAQGNTIHVTNYLFTDENPLPGDNYYRLVEVDFDGKTQVSNIIVVNSNDGDNASIQMYPNPAENEATLSTSLKENTVITITDMNGKLIQEISVNANTSSVKINTEQFAGGIYFVTGTNSNEISFCEKLTVLKQ